MKYYYCFSLTDARDEEIENRPPVHVTINGKIKQYTCCCRQPFNAPVCNNQNTIYFGQEDTDNAN